MTLNDFEDYYRVVSASLPEDNYFRILMWSVWDLGASTRIGHGNTQHNLSVVDRADQKRVGSHKPGPAHRAQDPPIISRSLDAQRIVNSVAQHKDSRIGVGGNGHSVQGAHRAAIGILPSSGPSYQFQYQSRHGTDDAVRRTYQSSLHGLVGGSTRNFVQKDQMRNTSEIIEAPSDREVVAAVSRNILASLRDRGVHGFVALLRAFEVADTSRIGNLPLDEFFKVLRSSGFSVSHAECEAIFRLMNLSSGNKVSDQIDYGRFVGEHLCGINLNQSRLAVIHQSFAKFDTNNNGFVPLDHLHSGYCAARHPDVTSGRRSVFQVQQEFVDNFTVADGYGKVSIEAFEMYFKFVSACISEDADFQVSRCCVFVTMLVL